MKYNTYQFFVPENKNIYSQNNRIFLSGECRYNLCLNTNFIIFTLKDSPAWQSCQDQFQVKVWPPVLLCSLRLLNFTSQKNFDNDHFPKIEVWAYASLVLTVSFYIIVLLPNRRVLVGLILIFYNSFVGKFCMFLAYWGKLNLLFFIFL